MFELYIKMPNISAIFLCDLDKIFLFWLRYRNPTVNKNLQTSPIVIIGSPTLHVVNQRYIP